MTRRFLSLGVAGCALALLPLHVAVAEDLPVRKAGLWEMKIAHEGRNLPTQQMKQCTDETSDKQMQASFGGMAQDMEVKPQMSENRTATSRSSARTRYTS